jgi:hypothetical protein
MVDTTSMKTPQGREQRSSPRYPVSMPVKLSSDFLVFEGTAEVEGVTSDLSASGLFVQSDLLEPVGTRVRVRVLVKDGEPIAMEGSIAWVAEEPPKGPGMGIALSRTDRAYHQLLRAIATRST